MKAHASRNMLAMTRSTYTFFFQAEDGIRDLYVTGVQTCALPISRGSREGSGKDLRERRRSGVAHGIGAARGHGGPAAWIARRLVAGTRSEERRVGKECRIRL